MFFPCVIGDGPLATSSVVKLTSADQMADGQGVLDRSGGGDAPKPSGIAAEP